MHLVCSTRRVHLTGSHSEGVTCELCGVLHVLAVVVGHAPVEGHAALRAVAPEGGAELCAEVKGRLVAQVGGGHRCAEVVPAVHLARTDLRVGQHSEELGPVERRGPTQERRLRGQHCEVVGCVRDHEPRSGSLSTLTGMRPN